MQIPEVCASGTHYEVGFQFVESDNGIVTKYKFVYQGIDILIAAAVKISMRCHLIIVF